MAVYEYVGQCAGGTAISGQLEAEDSSRAAALLGEMGVDVRELREAAAPPARRPLSHVDVEFFNQQLAALARSGMPLAEGLRQLAVDAASRPLRETIRAVAEAVQGGASLPDAIKAHESRFPPLYAEVLRAGVEAGQLAPILVSLNRHVRLIGSVRRLLVQTLSYPVAVLVLAALLITVVLRFLVPDFVGIFADFGTQLPPLTLLVLAIADHAVVAFGVVVAVVAGVTLAALAAGRSEGGRRWRERVGRRLPGIGRLSRNSYVARLCEGLALCVEGGMPLPRAWRLASMASGSALLAHEGQRVAKRLEAGAPFMEAAALAPSLPQVVAYSIQVAAERNELGPGLHQLGDMYAQQALDSQSIVREVAYPAVIVVVGLVMSVLIFALFLPLTTLVDALS
jgi:type II secretory pathway component PulF